MLMLGRGPPTLSPRPRPSPFPFPFPLLRPYIFVRLAAPWRTAEALVRAVKLAGFVDVGLRDGGVRPLTNEEADAVRKRARDDGVADETETRIHAGEIVMAEVTCTLLGHMKTAGCRRALTGGARPMLFLKRTRSLLQSPSTRSALPHPLFCAARPRQRQVLNEHVALGVESVETPDPVGLTDHGTWRVVSFSPHPVVAPPPADDDLVTEDDLLLPEDKAKPILSLDQADCGTGTTKKACKNCTCGMAELEEAQVKAQPQKGPLLPPGADNDGRGRAGGGCRWLRRKPSTEPRWLPPNWPRRRCRPPSRPAATYGAQRYEKGEGKLLILCAESVCVPLLLRSPCVVCAGRRLPVQRLPVPRSACVQAGRTGQAAAGRRPRRLLRWRRGRQGMVAG